jgi:hypothetical protein
VRQTGADGVQTELVTHYHNGSIEKFAQSYLLAERIGDPFPASLSSAAESK